MSLAVKSKTSDLVKCVVIDGGELQSRRHLNVRGKSATLPSITGWYYQLNVSQLSLHQGGFFLIQCWFLKLAADKDWEDIKFGVDNQVDFYAVSFVKDAKVVHELKNYLNCKSLSSVMKFSAKLQ